MQRERDKGIETVDNRVAMNKLTERGGREGGGERGRAERELDGEREKGERERESGE